MALGVDVINEKEHIRTLIPLGGGGYVVVDSSFCFVRGYDYETMVFPSDQKGTVLDFLELDKETYATVDEMVIGHKAMCKKWRQSNGI